MTHEPDIAAHARRQVHLKDGQVERDFATERERPLSHPIAPETRIPAPRLAA